MAVPDGFRRVRALSARTHFVPGHGQVHFDPDNSKFETRNPALPEDQIELLVERGWVADDLSEADLADDDQAPAAKRQSRKAKAVPTADDDQAPAA
ncbi:UNVERIFIED_ORG: cytochrome oxidase assembly protein ShyY1 [Sphingomonas sp. R1F5B]